LLPTATKFVTLIMSSEALDVLSMFVKSS